MMGNFKYLDSNHLPQSCCGCKGVGFLAGVLEIGHLWYWFQYIVIPWARVVCLIYTPEAQGPQGWGCSYISGKPRVPMLQLLCHLVIGHKPTYVTNNSSKHLTHKHNYTIPVRVAAYQGIYQNESWVLQAMEFNKNVDYWNMRGWFACPKYYISQQSRKMSNFKHQSL